MSSFKNLPMYDDSVADTVRARANVANLQNQQQLSQLPQEAWTKSTIQQAAGSLAEQQREVEAESFEQQLGSQMQQAELSLSQRELDNRNKIHQLRMSNEEKLREITNSLSALSSSLSNRLLDKQLQFQEDEIGRAIWTDQQLGDWAILQSKNRVELENYIQVMEQETHKQLYMYDSAFKAIEQRLTQEFKKEQQDRDNELMTELAEAQRALQQKMAEARAKAASRSALWQGAGTILGAGIGFAVSMGNPAGAMIGAGIGAGLGQIGSGLDSRDDF